MYSKKFIKLNVQQNGYILIVVLGILVLISLIIVAAYIGTTTTTKTSGGNVDKNLAQQIAESAALEASQQIAREFFDPNQDIFPHVADYDPSKYPVIFAELLEGGKPLMTINGQIWPQYFTNNCSGQGNDRHKGFCAPAITIKKIVYGKDKDGIIRQARDRSNVFNKYTGGKCVNARQMNAPTTPNGIKVARNPCYIVEFLGINAEKMLRYRITTIAWGQNPNTHVQIESIYEASYGENTL